MNAEPTSPLPADPAADGEDSAPVSRVGLPTGEPMPEMPGTDGMDAETGGLAGTSR